MLHTYHQSDARPFKEIYQLKPNKRTTKPNMSGNIIWQNLFVGLVGGGFQTDHQTYFILSLFLCLVKGGIRTTVLCRWSSPGLHPGFLVCKVIAVSIAPCLIDTLLLVLVVVT